MAKMPRWMKYGPIIGTIVILIGAFLIFTRTDWTQEIPQIDGVGAVTVIVGIIIAGATFIDFSYLAVRDRDSK